MLSIFRSLALILCFAAPSSLQAQDFSAWETAKSPPYFYAVDIVTVTAPGIRYKCFVKSVTPSTLTCKPHFGHVAKLFQKQDIAAIIEPPSHFTVRNVAVMFVVGAAITASSFFIPIAPLVLTFEILGGAAMGLAPLGLGFGNDDYNDDRILYQRPNTPLSVHLR